MKTEDLCIQGGRCQRILAWKGDFVGDFKKRFREGFLGVSRCQNSWDSGRFFFWNFWMYKVLMLKICYHYWRKVWVLFVSKKFGPSLSEKCVFFTIHHLKATCLVEHHVNHPLKLPSQIGASFSAYTAQKNSIVLGVLGWLFVSKTRVYVWLDWIQQPE